jgi:hypothetical protein
MLDRDLAQMYGVKTGVLNQAVKRNAERFPVDFMFRLSDEELKIWKSQFVISNSINMGIRNKPYAFTELGVAMLSSVINSPRAIAVNIEIMRAFVMLRHYALSYAELNRKLEDFMRETGAQFSDVYRVLDELSADKIEADKPRTPIGFQISGKCK